MGKTSGIMQDHNVTIRVIGRYSHRGLAVVDRFSKTLAEMLSVAGHCRSSVIQYKRYTNKLLSSTFKKKFQCFSYSKRFSTIIKILEPDQNFLMTAKRKG